MDAAITTITIPFAEIYADCYPNANNCQPGKNPRAAVPGPHTPADHQKICILDKHTKRSAQGLGPNPGVQGLWPSSEPSYTVQQKRNWARRLCPCPCTATATRSPGPAAEASRAESATTVVDSSRPGAESTNESGTVLVFDRVRLLTPPLLVPQNCVQRVLCACSRHYISRWNRFCTDFCQSGTITASLKKYTAAIAVPAFGRPVPL